MEAEIGFTERTTCGTTLSASAAARLGLKRVPVAAGGGDQAAGAVGAGVIAPGDASLALGTSGVLFIVTAGFRPNPDEAAHAFCHALPKRWHQTAVLLNAASAVDWAAGVTGFAAPAAGYAAAEAAGSSGGVQFLPYLTGERTPHDDPHACGVFFGMRLDTTAAMLVHAAMEGVAFAFADGRDALARAGGQCERATVIGGGARSTYWGKILAAVLDLPLTYCAGAETGPAHGAARLARLAVTGEDPAAVCGRGAVITVESFIEAVEETYPRFRSLIRCTSNTLGIASNLAEQGLRDEIGTVPTTDLKAGIQATVQIFERLQTEGRLDLSDLDT